jgi:NADH:ubiquinone oxidoreductase subunit E
VAPAMMVNDRVYGNLTAERIAGIIEGLRREK